MELPHYQEYLEHLCSGFRNFPPVLSTEADLGNLLPCAKAVKSEAALKTPFPEAIVNTTAKVGLQIKAGLPCLFIGWKSFGS